MKLFCFSDTTLCSKIIHQIVTLSAFGWNALLSTSRSWSNTLVQVFTRNFETTLTGDLTCSTRQYSTVPKSFTFLSGWSTYGRTLETNNRKASICRSLQISTIHCEGRRDWLNLEERHKTIQNTIQENGKDQTYRRNTCGSEFWYHEIIRSWQNVWNSSICARFMSSATSFMIHLFIYLNLQNVRSVAIDLKLTWTWKELFVSDRSDNPKTQQERVENPPDQDEEIFVSDRSDNHKLDKNLLEIDRIATHRSSLGTKQSGYPEFHFTNTSSHTLISTHKCSSDNHHNLCINSWFLSIKLV